MIEPEPLWEYASRRALVSGYEHARLLPEHVLAEWICLDRATGRPVWKHKRRGMRLTAGVAEGIAVVSRVKSGGAAYETAGCSGIRVDTGEIAWTARAPEPEGLLERLGQLLTGRDETPSYVDGDEVVCASGQILAVRTGAVRGRLGQDELRAREGRFFQESDARPDRSFQRSAAVDVPGVEGKLRRGVPVTPAGERGVMPDTGFSCFLERGDGDVVWRFDLDEALEVEGNLSSCRWVPPYLYLVASEGPRCDVRREKDGMTVSKPRAARYRILSLDARTGEVASDVALGDPALVECRIEDVDDTALLVGGIPPGLGRYRLRCYRRA